MPETAEEYKSRLHSYVEGKDPIAMQRETPAELARLMEGAAPAELKRRPAPGKWSVAEIVMHLAEDELVTAWRYRQVLQYDDPALPGFDQDLWAEWGDYGNCDPKDALALFRMLRHSNLRMLARLTPEQWQRSGTHIERGYVTVRELCNHMAAHDTNHLLQIKKILGR